MCLYKTQMKYLSDRSRSRRRYLNFGLGFVAFALFVYYWPALRTVAYPLAEPLMRGYGSTKGVLGSMPQAVAIYFSSHAELAKRNQDLEISVERLENDLAEKDALIRERFLAEHASSEGMSVISMYPVAEDVTKLYSTILLSKGYKDGIERGGPVYVRGRQAVCEITELYDRTSLCELFSKGDHMTEGVTSSSTVTLFLIGAGGGNFTAETVKGTEVLVGETVYLRSDQTFVLGTVVAVKEEEQSTGAKVYVRGAYNPVKSSIFYMNARYAP